MEDTITLSISEYEKVKEILQESLKAFDEFKGKYPLNYNKFRDTEDLALRIYSQLKELKKKESKEHIPEIY